MLEEREGGGHANPGRNVDNAGLRCQATDVLSDKMQELAEVCRRHRVQRLALFGSAAQGDFDPTTSDLDFVVEFQPMSPGEHADHYFGLMRDLERLFGRQVDLVEAEAIRNRIFKRVVETTRVIVYEAA
jgi:predicted nucleotidyltransferase